MAKKDFYTVWTYTSPDGEKDKDLKLPNLEVVNLMKSLKSSGYVKETFNWCVYPRHGERGTGEGAGGKGDGCRHASYGDPMRGGWVVMSFSSSSSFSFFILIPTPLLSPKSPTYLPNPYRQYYYYYLTVEGIDYLRQYLNLPQDVVPQTHQKKEGRPARPAGFADRGDRPEGERERRPFDKEKRLGPDGSFQPSFGGGGFGRGGGNRGGGGGGGDREYRG